jgi:DNA polymerase-3 subunit delta'
MSFARVLGQRAAVKTLRSALESGRVHHAYRFEGPSGVGKELAAFAFAQALVCPEALKPGFIPDSRSLRATTLSEEPPHVPLHPDVVLVARGLYPKELIGAAEAASISVQQIRRVVLPRAGFPPHEAPALVFIVRDAEELTTEAANALLKTLEEPHDRVHFVLLTSNPHRLLDTVRSRTLPVRFGPLADDVVATILEERGLPKEVAPLAEGSAGLALALADEAQMQTRQAFIDDAMAALAARGLDRSLDFAATFAKDREGLRGLLRALSHHFALEARDSIKTNPSSALKAAKRFRLVLETIKAVERNAQPTLSVEAMMNQLRRS